MQRLRLLLAAAALFAVWTGAVRAQDPQGERFAVLEAGTATYSNVLVMNKTKTDVFIRHSGGLTSIKVKDLDKTTQLQLGYQLVLEPATNKMGRAESSAPLAGLELDPRYEEIKEQIIWEAQEFWNGLERNVIYAGAGGVVLLYLFFCFCCHLVCRKAGTQPGVLVWLPLLKQIPLFRAAGMRPWWFITMFIPGINIITYIVWSFKIARARGKGTLTSIMLLLPLFNVLAFLYLAFSQGVEATAEPAGPRKLVALGQSQRRNAA